MCIVQKYLKNVERISPKRQLFSEQGHEEKRKGEEKKNEAKKSRTVKESEAK